MASLKSLKKGDKVILRVFTGAYSSTKVVQMADANRVGIVSNSGIRMTFSKETGKQLTPAPKNVKFASYIDDWSAEVEKEECQKKAKRTKKPTKKHLTGPKKRKIPHKVPEDDWEELD